MRHCPVVSELTSRISSATRLPVRGFRKDRGTRRGRLDIILVHRYIYNMKEQIEHPLVVERVQTGVRMEKRLLKVLKGLAELKDMTLGDLLEGIVLHAFEGKAPFSDNTLKEIEKLRGIYGLTLKAADSHQLKEKRR